jgi:CheY-like chemotaxis protein
LRVLVVDDNATNRRILEEVLSNWHMRTVGAESGVAALARLDQATASGEPFALILLDAHMPQMDGFTVARRIKEHPDLADPVVVMLTSAGQPQDFHLCQELGIRAYLLKPIKQSELREVLVSALGRSAGECMPAPETALVPVAARSLRVLVAEDNVVNQRLAAGLLERAGHTAVIASTGKEALNLLTPDIDVVLMDVQMPVMDGFEATAAIREAERASGRHVPIVALTAHALFGDQERCLAAGMDAYLTKPIRAQHLNDVLDRIVASRRREETIPPAAAFIPAEALAQVGGDEALLRELAQLFLDSYPSQLADLRAARERHDDPELGRVAHALKGAVAVFGADAAEQTARAVETQARAGKAAEAERASLALERAILDLHDLLVRLAAGK